MSWKANTAGLTVFIAGTLIVAGVNMPKGLYEQGESGQLAYQQKAEEVEKMRTETIDEIIINARDKHGLNLTQSEANRLNCRTENSARPTTKCFHRIKLLNNDSALPIMADGTTPPVERYGTISIDDAKYTLESYAGSASFYIKKH